VSDWSLSEDDMKNPIVVSALQIQDEDTFKFSYRGGDARSAENAALQVKFEKHEMLIMEMKAEIRNLRLSTLEVVMLTLLLLKVMILMKLAVLLLNKISMNR